MPSFKSNTLTRWSCAALALSLLPGCMSSRSPSAAATREEPVTWTSTPASAPVDAPVSQVAVEPSAPESMDDARSGAPQAEAEYAPAEEKREAPERRASPSKKSLAAELARREAALRAWKVRGRAMRRVAAAKMPV